MQTPGIASLRAAAPRARITGIGARPAIELLDCDPGVDEVRDVHELGFDHWADKGDCESERRVHAWLDQRRFDVVLNPYDAVFGLRRVLWERGGPMFDVDLDVVRSWLEAGASGNVALNAGARDGWGIDVPLDLEPSLHVRSEHREEARGVLGDLADEPLIAISPVASSSLKRWPLERLAAVADRLVAATGFRLLVLAGPHEEASNRLLSAMREPRRALSIGRLHLATTAALFERVRLFIGNDTGLMHVASAVRAPTLAIFGPTAPEIYRPASRLARSVGGEGIDCEHRHATEFGPPGCWGLDRCLIESASCVHRVEEDEVFRAACGLLGWEAGALTERAQATLEG